LAQLNLPPKALVAVLVGIEKPGNVGAVLRSADGPGVSAVIVADGATDLYNPNCIRASLGTVFTMQVCGVTSDETIAWLREREFQGFRGPRRCPAKLLRRGLSPGKRHRAGE